MRGPVLVVTTLCIAFMPVFSFAAIEFDQNVTTNVIFGTGGNLNGGFTTDRNSDEGLELGLRAKIRFPSPQNTFLSMGNGDYGSFAVGGPGGNTPNWSFEWSINTAFNKVTGLALNAYEYALRLDTNPSQGVDFFSFNPIGVPFADHSFGNNGTANDSGTEAVDSTEYGVFIADPSKNLAQNSWRMDFFFGPSTFDPAIDGTYTFELEAFDDLGASVALTTIDVIVGAGGAPVPEPLSFLTWGGLIGCAIVAARRHQRS